MAKNDWQICILGALDGLIYVGAARLVRFYFDYLERAPMQDGSSVSPYYINIASHQENWLGVAFLVVVMFVVAAYGVHRYWSASWRRHLIAWLVIGIAAITVWNIFALAVSIWERVSSGQAAISEGITSL